MQFSPGSVSLTDNSGLFIIFVVLPITGNNKIGSEMWERSSIARKKSGHEQSGLKHTGFFTTSLII